MVWVDGSTVDYNNWPNKSPDPNLLSADVCVTTRGADGMWHLLQCTEQLGFICKTAISKLNRCSFSQRCLNDHKYILRPSTNTACYLII